jgi:uncharacterized protein
MSSRPLVLHHDGCADGFCAAWAARRAMPDAECVPVQYGQPPPEVAGRQVYVLDFSYKRDVMVDMAKAAHSLTVLDHHKTAAAEFVGLVHGNALTIANSVADRFLLRFDMGHSGGRLAWDHFFPDDAPPWLVDYTEDRDLWRWALPLSREVNSALRSHPFEFALWDSWAGWQYRPGEPQPLGERLQDFAAEGAAILRAERQTVADHVRHAAEVEIAGHRVLAVNATTLTSEIAGELAKGRPFGACYFTGADGKTRWSLRSREGGVDVSAVAKQFGGGGHAAAAGYEVSPVKTS